MKIIKNVGLVLGVALSIFAISCAVLAWNPPSVQPTGGNVAEPVNVGSSAQTKNGNLQINGRVGVGSSHSSFGLNVGSGHYSYPARFRVGSGPYVYLGYSNYGIYSVGTRHYLSGNVGIGTTSPTQRLDVVGNAKIRGDIVASGNITAKEPTAANHLTTKNYVDNQIVSTIEPTISPAALVYYVKDDTNYSPDCPVGTTIVGKHWMAKSCSLPGYSPYITFSGGWYGASDSPSEAGAYDNWGCAPDHYDAVMCAGPDPANMLFALEHTITDCTSTGGTVETVEGGVKICKFHYSYLSGNCRGVTPEADTCLCPTGWKSYKEWSTTSNTICWWATNTIKYPHEWSNIARERCWDEPSIYQMAIVDYKGCY